MPWQCDCFESCTHQKKPFTVTSFEGNALYNLQDRLRKMAESPSRYSLPPEEKSSKAKKLSTRKRKAPPSEKKETGKIQIDF